MYLARNAKTGKVSLTGNWDNLIMGVEVMDIWWPALRFS